VVVEGLRLMAVGMFTVFAFLTLLVALMAGSAAFFEANAHRFSDDDSDGSSTDRKDNGRDEEVAIALAVIEATRRGQKV
jgi:Na+-transporting methylmalonyl-CoA/oxaloacetate decarboxylase gamma subunit